MRLIGLGFLLVAAIASQAPAAVVYTTVGSTYSENFDGLASSGASNTWANDSTLPGWYLYRQPEPGTAIATYAAGTGSSNTGAFYSFGTTAADRALGGLGSGGAYFGSPATNAIAGWIAFAVQNATGAALDAFTVTYDGEQWRNGGNASAQTMVVEYGIGETFQAVSSWTEVSALAFTSPVTGATAGAHDGNLAANRVADITATITQTIASGATLWVRFVERNDPGNDHGLAVDNFRFSAAGAPAVVIPEPSAMLLCGLGLAGLAVAARRRRAA